MRYSAVRVLWAWRASARASRHSSLVKLPRPIQARATSSHCSSTLRPSMNAASSSPVASSG